MKDNFFIINTTTETVTIYDSLKSMMDEDSPLETMTMNEFVSELAYEFDLSWKDENGDFHGSKIEQELLNIDIDDTESEYDEYD